MSGRRQENERLARHLLGSWAEAWRAPALRTATLVENPRLRTTLGRCRVKESVIELSSAVLGLPAEKFTEILCHEAAHLAVHQRHGRVRPHGREWAALVSESGFAPLARLPHDPSLPLPAARRRRAGAYLHRCPVCRLARAARTSARRWLCARCVAEGRPGELLVSRIDG